MTDCALCDQSAIAIAPPDGQPSCPTCDARCNTHLTEAERAAMLRAAAFIYKDRGIVAIPVRNDVHGKPKVAISRGWPNFTIDSPGVEVMPWSQADGIANLLGPASGNICAIDVDHVAAGDAVLELLTRTGVSTRVVNTFSGRKHVYFREQRPSPTTQNLTVEWQGETFGVELRVMRSLVTAPPSRGYSVAMNAPIITVPSVMDAWINIRDRLGMKSNAPRAAGAGYPAPWQSSVGKGDRNKTAYVEAHRLREAHMPIGQALAIIRARYDSAHEKGDESWPELEATVRSAYKGGLPPHANLVTSWRPDNIGGWAT